METELHEHEKVSILLVDDKHANIMALHQLLKKPERHFIECSSGSEALKVALGQPIDLVILDVQMPDMDGFEVAQILKSNKRTKDIPVIFVSAARKEHNSIMKGFEEGAVDYLLKPLDPEMTRAKVSVLLKLQTQQKELMKKNESLEKADLQIRQLNSELEKKMQQLENTNRELEAFSYSISHDLRAPLRAIGGYSHILEEELQNTQAGNEENTRLIGNIKQNVNRMNTLIDDLLEFSRMGKKPVTKSLIDMKKQVEQVLQEIDQNTQHKATIQVHELLSAQADHALMVQVWTNLLANAIKYSGKKENPHIEVSSTDNNDEIVYMVKDNGAGFDMHHANRLFGVFQRLHTESDFPGTGIGLAIIQRIVVRHGGRVWAEGKINEGACFYFSLPK